MAAVDQSAALFATILRSLDKLCAELSIGLAVSKPKLGTKTHGSGPHHAIIDNLAIRIDQAGGEWRTAEIKREMLREQRHLSRYSRSLSSEHDRGRTGRPGLLEFRRRI